MLGRLHLLLIQDGSKWQELPEWARFFVRLGFEVGRRPVEDRRLIVAVGVPARFLAAAAASAGVVAGRISGDGSSAHLQEHYCVVASWGFRGDSAGNALEVCRRFRRRFVRRSLRLVVARRTVRSLPKTADRTYAIHCRRFCSGSARAPLCLSLGQSKDVPVTTSQALHNLGKPRGSIWPERESTSQPCPRPLSPTAWRSC